MICDHDIILESIDRAYGSKPTGGIVHSVTTLVALLSFSKLYSALVLFDPPLTKPGASQLELHVAAEQAATIIWRREHRFKKREDFIELLGFFPTFELTVPGIHELMERTTLRLSASGEEYELRCPRECEAQLMDYARRLFPLLDLDLNDCPTKIIGADPTLPYAYLPMLDHWLASAIDYDFIPGATHFLQLEKPVGCVSVTCEFLERHALV